MKQVIWIKSIDLIKTQQGKKCEDVQLTDIRSTSASTEDINKADIVMYTDKTGTNILKNAFGHMGIIKTS